MHYETRLKEGLGDGINHAIAMEILAEAATQNLFTGEARYRLDQLYSALVEDTTERIAGVLDVLEHDGYLESDEEEYRFVSKLLKDWWSARFRYHYKPLLERGGSTESR